MTPPRARERDNSKGRLIRTRNSFFIPDTRENVIRSVRSEKRKERGGGGGSSGRTKNKLHAMFHNFRRHGIETTSHLHRPLSARAEYREKVAHPYVTRIGEKRNPKECKRKCPHGKWREWGEQFRIFHRNGDKDERGKETAAESISVRSGIDNAS